MANRSFTGWICKKNLEGLLEGRIFMRKAKQGPGKVFPPLHLMKNNFWREVLNKKHLRCAALVMRNFQESMENAKRTYEILNSGENWEQYNYISK